MKAICVLASAGSAASVVEAACPPAKFDSIKSFDLQAYAAKRWYVQQQSPTAYNPVTQNYCAYAEYTLREKPTSLGYDIDVHNYAEEKDGTVHDTGSLLKAKIVDEKRGKLRVAAFSVPAHLAGPYWVIDYSKRYGYALVSGGPPTVKGKYGRCKNPGGTNGAGLWILTRKHTRDEGLVKKVRLIAQSKGFDVSVLNNVAQVLCRHGYYEERQTEAKYAPLPNPTSYHSGSSHTNKLYAPPPNPMSYHSGSSHTSKLYAPPPKPTSYHSDKVLVTLGLMRYPGISSAKDLGGHVVVTTDNYGKHYGQHLSYNLKGVDPYCVTESYKTDPYPSKYICGINIREGEDCGKPKRTLWDRDWMHSKNPWLPVRYNAVDYDSRGDVIVKTHVKARKVSGKVLVVHDSKGERLACSKLVPVSLVYARHLTPYPGADTRYCVGGQVDMKSVEGYQVLSYKLYGIDPQCSTTGHLPKNGCGIHIHEGKECEDAAGHLHAHDSHDPWLSVRYYAEGDKATAGDVKVNTGLHMKDILYRTVVIHDKNGKRISCSKLYPVKHLVAHIARPYLFKPAVYLVIGDVTIVAYDGYHVVQYKLDGIDPQCSDSGTVPKYGCGIRIHEGSSCDEPGATYWDRDEVGKDPYKRVRYYSDKDGSTYGQVTMYGGYDLSDVVHKVVLVYDYDGKAIACKALLPPPVKDPVCGMKPNTPAEVFFVRGKDKECLPGDAVVQLPGEAGASLDTVVSGDKVLTRTTASELSYEPIIGFLHSIPAKTPSSLLIVTHEHGQLRATGNHIVFVADDRADLQERALRDLQVHEALLFTRRDVNMISRVISIRAAVSEAGLISPLTASGTIIDDDIVVSVYARGGGQSAGHSAIHSAFYLLRAATFIFGMPLQFFCRTVSQHFASRLAFAFGEQSHSIK
eukprot:TRINITY_DN4680_c0_g2_i1.p1 TRINITY_DN4680_c0_g2~~TRINITY_DN4680_c0_g2_i1.p1  ORF type:complete len:911 (-),score=103.93 TRINITY_DN4680_c0_g2_i1:321-3053(-)